MPNYSASTATMRNGGAETREPARRIPINEYPKVLAAHGEYLLQLETRLLRVTEALLGSTPAAVTTAEERPVCDITSAIELELSRNFSRMEMLGSWIGCIEETVGVP